MKKIAILAAAAFCGAFAPAQETAPTPAPAASVSQAEIDAAIDDMLALMSEVMEIMESAQDKATADAAAAKLAEYRTRMLDSQTKFESISESLTEEQQMLILQKVFPQLMAMGPRMEAVEQKLLEADFYGSEALKAILTEDRAEIDAE